MKYEAGTEWYEAIKAVERGLSEVIRRGDRGELLSTGSQMKTIEKLLVVTLRLRDSVQAAHILVDGLEE